MEAKNDLYIIRDGTPGDFNFIFSTWLKGLRYGNELYKLIDPTIYFKQYHKVLELLLKSAHIKIACLKDDPDTILGYAVSTGACLHWIFVKKAWRGIGIARNLMSNDISSVSHITEVGIKILKRYPGIIFNPFL